LEEGYIRLAASDRIANTSVFRFAANNDARFQMQGFSETLGGLDSGSSTGTQVVEGATNAAATLTLSVGSGSYTYGGFLRDSASGIHANNLSLVKDGAGTQVLSGGTTQVNYSGSTTVNAGVLEFAGTNNAANNSAITLAGGTVRFSGGGMRSNTIAGTGNLEKTGANTLTLSGSNSYTDGTTISGGTLEMGNGGSVAGNITNNALLSINRTDSSTLGNLVSGTGALNKSGSGTATMTASNSYSGATAVNGGVLRVASGGSIASSSTSVNNSGTLVVDGTAGNVTVNSGGTLKGTGTVGALEIASGGTLAVGNSPGQLNAGTTTWASGGAFEWEINSFPGTAGTNWDFLNITGNLNITATSSAGSQFLIDVVSLLPGADSFNPMVNYSFAIATASAGITGFDVDKFTLSTTRFLNGFDGLWSINTAAGPSGGSSQSLVLSYTASATAIPEPSTCALLTLAAAGLMLRRPRSAPRT
jgi:autotransporter-associated beta strand protein